MTDTVKSWIKERRTATKAGDRVDQIADAQRNLPRALNAFEQVLKLHQPMGVFTGFVPVCAECEEIGGGDVAWPCPTVQTIEGAINE